MHAQDKVINRGRTPVSASHRDAVLRLMNGRHTAAQIAALTGVRRTYVYTVAKRFGREERLCRAGSGPTNNGLPASVVLRDLCLSPDIAAWLIAQTASGASVQDVIRGVLVDAYEEETGL